MPRIRFLAVLLLVLALVAVACGDDSGGDEDADPDPVPADETTTTTTTTLPGTTQPVPDDAEALVDLSISAVEFGEAGFVTITNLGADDADLNGINICQFPNYMDLGTIVDGGVIAAGDSIQVAAANWGGLDAASGEAALYNGTSFDSAEAILAYVQWGAGGAQRASVAVEAGIWPSVDAFVTPDPAFPNIESGGDPADPANWS